jgi:hypothetical protein
MLFIPEFHKTGKLGSIISRSERNSRTEGQTTQPEATPHKAVAIREMEKKVWRLTQKIFPFAGHAFVCDLQDRIS